MKFLSAPDFVVQDFPFPTHFLTQLPSFAGLKLAYVDEPPATEWNGRVALCLHGEPTWSYLYRKMIPLLLQAGYRVVAAAMESSFDTSNSMLARHANTALLGRSIRWRAARQRRPV